MSSDVTNGHTGTHVFDLRVSVCAEATISDSATATLNSGNDGRSFGPPPSRHFPELKSR